jgi:hypothetical protein
VRQWRVAQRRPARAERDELLAARCERAEHSERVLTDALRNASAERDAAVLDGGEQLRCVRADCDRRLQLEREACDGRVNAMRTECNAQLQTVRAECYELRSACALIDGELASNGVARGLQGVEQLADANADLSAAHAASLSALRAELEACDAPRTDQGVQTVLSAAAPTAEQGVQTALAASGSATGAEMPPRRLIAVRLRAATGRDQGGVIVTTDLAVRTASARDSCTSISSSPPIAAKLAPSVTVPAAKPGEWLAATGASAALVMMPPVVASVPAGASPSASSVASPRASALGLLATPPNATPTSSPDTAPEVSPGVALGPGVTSSAMLVPRAPPTGLSAARPGAALEVNAASPELQLPPGLGPEGACRRRAMVDILRGTGAQPLQGKENERSRRRRVARQLLALTPRPVVLAAAWAFKLRNRARHRASVLLRCELLLKPLARRYLDELRRRAHSRKQVVKLLESSPRVMDYDVICDMTGAFSFCSMRGAISDKHPAWDPDGPTGTVPAYSPDGGIVAPQWPPTEGPGSTWVLAPEVNGAWCYVDTVHGTTSWLPPAGSTLEPPPGMARRFAERHEFPCYPPALDSRLRLGSLGGTPWLPLRNDAQGSVLLVCRTTGLVRDAPWISLCDADGRVFFGNLLTRRTRWFPPNRWWADMVSRPRDMVSRPHAWGGIADELIDRRHPCMREFLGVGTSRLMVEGGSPYLGEFGKPQYASDPGDTADTYPWVDETGSLLAEAEPSPCSGRVTIAASGSGSCFTASRVEQCLGTATRPGDKHANVPRCPSCTRRWQHSSPAG